MKYKAIRKRDGKVLARGLEIKEQHGFMLCCFNIKKSPSCGNYRAHYVKGVDHRIIGSGICPACLDRALKAGREWKAAQRRRSFSETVLFVKLKPYEPKILEQIGKDCASYMGVPEEIIKAASRDFDRAVGEGQRRSDSFDNFMESELYQKSLGPDA